MAAFVVVLSALFGWAPAIAHADDAAPAQPTAAEEAEALYHLADREDAALHFADALRHYEAALARSSSFRYAPRARARADLLRTHAEGDFAPLARLERVRRDAHASSDPAELEELARAADSFPPGRVRVEARHLVAEAYLGRLNRPDDALPILRVVLADPSTDPLTARQASRELVGALLDRGSLDEAAAAARLPGADASLAQEVTTRLRRRLLHRGSIAVLAVFVIAAAASALQRRREAGTLVRPLGRFGKLALAFAAWTALAGGGLASSYETGNATPFLLFGAALVPLLLLARTWALCGSSRREAMALRAIVTATSVLAAGFLVLELVDVSYLQDFGL